MTCSVNTKVGRVNEDKHVNISHQYLCQLPEKRSKDNVSSCLKCGGDEICLKSERRFACVNEESKDKCSDDLCPRGSTCEVTKRGKVAVAICQFGKQIVSGERVKAAPHKHIFVNNAYANAVRRRKPKRGKKKFQGLKIIEANDALHEHDGEGGIVAERVVGRRGRITEFEDDKEDLRVIADPVQRNRAEREQMTTEASTKSEIKIPEGDPEAEAVMDEPDSALEDSDSLLILDESGIKSRLPLKKYAPILERVKKERQKMVIREQDNPVAYNRDNYTKEDILPENRGLKRANPELRINSGGKIGNDSKDGSYEEIEAERPHDPAVPAFKIDSRGIPGGKANEKSLFEQDIGDFKGVTRRPGEYNPGTLQAVNGRRLVLDNDLVNRIERREKFVRNRENQVVGPKTLNVDSKGRVIDGNRESSTTESPKKRRGKRKDERKTMKSNIKFVSN